PTAPTTSFTRSGCSAASDFGARSLMQARGDHGHRPMTMIPFSLIRPWPPAKEARTCRRGRDARRPLSETGDSCCARSGGQARVQAWLVERPALVTRADDRAHYHAAARHHRDLDWAHLWHGHGPDAPVAFQDRGRVCRRRRVVFPRDPAVSADNADLLRPAA